MKKIITITLALALALGLAACHGRGYKDGDENLTPPTATDGENISNPVLVIDFTDALSELGLKSISFGGDYTCHSVTKIDGDITIIDFEVGDDTSDTSDTFDVRIARAVEGADCDISGVYLGGKIDSMIADSADYALAPSVEAGSDGENSKAFCEWNGYFFSVSAQGKMKPEEICSVCTSFAQAVISVGNIAPVEDILTDVATVGGADASENTTQVLCDGVPLAPEGFTKPAGNPVGELVEIIDTVNRDGLTTDAALEEFWHDADHTYCFPSIRADLIECHFSNGDVINVKDALNRNLVTLADLDAFHIGYWIVDKDGNYTKSAGF